MQQFKHHFDDMFIQINLNKVINSIIVNFKTTVKIPVASLIVLIMTCALMNTSFAQGNSNISNTLGNNTSVSSGSNVLQGISNDGAFKVMVDWKSNNINKENTFNLTFINSNSSEQIKDIPYDIMLFKDDQHITESHRSAQTAEQQKYVFADQGSYTLRIENINNTGASIDLPMQVIPEFPLSIFALMIALFGTIIIARMSKLADSRRK
ncbi:MAG TPA: hypothetical protein VKA95_05760 [Nitrososphaeraceae archaeon]|nr:hypothetical protein [Nitrososphaeraceae archaeon]